MIVSNQDDCYRAYCFTCHDSGFIKKQLPLSERIAIQARRQRADDEARACVNLPHGSEPIVQLWPDHARVWLHKAGLGVEEIMRLGFLYNERMDRVIMPVLRGDEVVFWQARGFAKGVPKYLSPSVDRRKVVPQYGKPDGWVVLTEDIISATKVGLVAHAWSLMGTQLGDYALLEILRQQLSVIIALDPDPAGRAGAVDVYQRLTAYGIPCISVTSLLTVDPKLMTRDQLTTLIAEAKCQLVP